MLNLYSVVYLGPNDLAIPKRGSEQAHKPANKADNADGMKLGRAKLPKGFRKVQNKIGLVHYSLNLKGGGGGYCRELLFDVTTPKEGNGLIRNRFRAVKLE